MFLEAVQNAVDKFKETKGPVRIISHLDADGLTSAAILIKALQREQRKFAVSIFRNLTKENLEEVNREKYKTVVFCDLGSGYLSLINEIIKDKDIFILDHHQIEKVKVNFVHINPLMYKVDGATEICGAGVVYFFAKALNEKNKDLAYLAIIGAIGDVQEDNGFLGLNNEILEDAKNKIEIKTGLRMFGAQTRPLHKVLEYSTDPYIPGISGDEKAVINFLDELDIKIKEKDKFRKLINLSKDEIKRLSSAIIVKRINHGSSEDGVLGPIYLIKGEEDESPTRDAREFSTLLNSCGRLNKPSLGIGVCLGSKDSKEKAIDILQKYRKEIVNGLNWFYNNRKTSNVIEQNGFVIINAGENIRDTLVGTVGSVLAKSGIFPFGTIILGLASTIDGNLKGSIRVAGRTKGKNLKVILEKISKSIGCSAGGHDFAAGCLIPGDKEEDFIENAKNILAEEVIG